MPAFYLKHSKHLNIRFRRGLILINTLNHFMSIRSWMVNITINICKAFIVYSLNTTKHD
jgi:hypothetical protein